MTKLFAAAKDFFKDPLRFNRFADTGLQRPQRNSRRSIRVATGYPGRSQEGNRLYWWMFGQDQHLHVIPYPTGETEAILCPSDPALERIITEGIETRGQGSRFKDSVMEFVRNTTQVIYTFGDAYYEIVYLPQKKGELQSFKLEPIYAPTMRKIFGTYFQIISPSAAKIAHIKIGIKHIPKETILHITAPRELGGRRRTRKIMSGLLSHGSVPTPKFTLESLSDPAIGFDVMKYNAQRILYRARITRDYGWSQRIGHDSPFLEYYELTRDFRSRRASILVRENILKQLNGMLGKDIMQLPDQKIVVRAKYTLKDIAEAEASLKSGNVTVKDILKKLR